MSRDRQTVESPPPPQATEAEERLLGAILLAGGDSLDHASTVAAHVRDTGLDPRDFYRESHARIWRACLALLDRGQPPDPLLVIGELERAGELDDAGGRARVQELAAAAAATANAAHYAGLIRDAARQRELIRTLSPVLDAARSGGCDTARALDAIDRARVVLDGAAPAGGGGWQPVPVADAADGTPARQPDRLGGLLYGAGAVTLLSGEPGVGKSMLLAAIAAEEAIAGRTALYVDLEGSPGMLLDRLHAAGLTGEQLARILYLRPQVRAEPTAIRQLVADLRPSLVAVDSYDAALAAYGLETTNEDIRALSIALLEPLRSGGAPIVVADHVAKDRERRGRYTIGGQAKLALCDAHLGLTVITPLRRGSAGRLRLTAHKDWHGHLPRAATLEITSHPATGALSWAIRPADDDADDGDGFRPTGLMERVSRALEIAGGPLSRTQLEHDVRGKGAYVRQAIDALVREGHATEVQGARGARLVSLARPYREGDE